MSTEIAETASTDIADIREQIANDIAKMRERVEAPSSNKIGLKNKQFSIPGKDPQAGPITGVIIDFTTKHVLYRDSFNEQNPSPAICWAIGNNIKTLAPSPMASEPQSTDCASCPKNQYGTASNGKGKACQNRRVLAVLPPDGNHETPLLTIEVSPGGLKNFDDYIWKLGSEGKTPVTVVTEISMDPSVSYSKLMFKEVGENPLLGEHYGRLQQARDLISIEPSGEVEAAESTAVQAGTRRKRA